ncbi:hypothetical protein AAT19DRAFT_11398 [Rhodotorula toruloides]|uniref:Uncharacterized protein n=1 Tax=Rhodotorula toruloides TaxID=5286 RepID=A0A2S9ZWN0_RHOTO|nr:hypothetical protein AAT19DRAFT_11398 [Rhodotorula toruloides]
MWTGCRGARDLCDREATRRRATALDESEGGGWEIGRPGSRSRQRPAIRQTSVECLPVGGRTRNPFESAPARQRRESRTKARGTRQVLLAGIVVPAPWPSTSNERDSRRTPADLPAARCTEAYRRLDPAGGEADVRGWPGQADDGRRGESRALSRSRLSIDGAREMQSGTSVRRGGSEEEDKDVSAVRR